MYRYVVCKSGARYEARVRTARQHGGMGGAEGSGRRCEVGDSVQSALDPTGVNPFTTTLYRNIYLTSLPSNLSPKRDCSPKGVKVPTTECCCCSRFSPPARFDGQQCLPYKSCMSISLSSPWEARRSGLADSSPSQPQRGGRNIRP